MTDMIEKVARALCANAFTKLRHDPTRAERDVYIASQWPDHIGAATAAIEAMRELTEAMMDAYTDAADDSEGPMAMYIQRDAYTAMIDAALGKAP